MSISVGAKPPEYSGKDPAEIQKHEEQMKEYWFAMQAAQQELTEESAAQSNMQKAKHDAMMNIINNTK